MVSSYQLFLPKQYKNQSTSLGTLSSAYSVVKTKNPLTLDWRDAFVGNDIAENQLIYTDHKASAEISFVEGAQLFIGENSLIKITSRSNLASINLEKGMVKAKLTNSEPLLLEMNGKEFQFTGENAEIQINLKDAKGEVGVISGEVRVESEGVDEKINQKRALEIERHVVKTKIIYFQTTSPEENQLIFTATPKALVNFSWHPEEEGHVFIANSPHMENARKLQASPEELSPGNYYWRVTGPKGDSLIQNFKIRQEVAPKVLRPKHLDTVELLRGINETSSPLILQWEGEPGSEYQLEWGGDSLESQTITGSRQTISITDSGLLRWRVRLLQKERPLAQWSDWQEVNVNVLLPPEIPKNLSPDGFEYQTYKNSEEKIDLSWISPSPVELEILSPDGSSQILRPAGEKFDLLIKNEGLYKWRLRSFDNYERKSDWTDWKQFELLNLSDESLESGIQRVQLKKPDQLVNFNWEKREGSVSVFELARDASFKDVITKREVESDTAKVVVPVVGTYYWRSRQYLPDGTLHSSEPVKVIIEPTPDPVKPEKLPDMEIPIEWKKIESKSSWNILNFIIPSAHADEVLGVVNLTLPESEEVKSFHIRIYQDPELKNLVLEKKTNSKNFEWVDVRPGLYYWQYSVTDFWDRQSPFSEPAVLNVTAREIPKPEKPKLKSPIRAAKIEKSQMSFNWTSSNKNDLYLLQISQNKSFKNILIEKKTRQTHIKLKPSELKISNGLFYWRIISQNSLGQETSSNTGRFIIEPPLERIIISDAPSVWMKQWRPRASFSWTPSLDTYSFKQDGVSGEIDGQAIMGFEIKGTYFQKKWIYNAEVMRQTGKVFEDLDYLFQRVIIDPTYTFYKTESNHFFSAGIALGQSFGQEYAIQEGEVKVNAVSGLSYGPILRSFHPLNQNWEVQTKGVYLLGPITQIEIEGQAFRQWKHDYFFTGSVGYIQREYEVNEGAQTSLKISLGLGKEF